MHNANDASAAPGEPVPGLAALVVKQGVGIGGLAEAQRDLALGLVWAGLPRTVLSEPAVNQALRAQLATAARCLATDHVELRRWLCDAGWLQRDAWGREYRRCETPQLPPALRALGEALERGFDGGDTAAWVERRRAEREAERAARRQAHALASAAAGHLEAVARP